MASASSSEIAAREAPAQRDARRGGRRGLRGLGLGLALTLALGPGSARPGAATEEPAREF
jgi:hypothetical protein